MLTDTTKERFGITFTARDVRLVEGGVTGAVGTSRIVLGTAALMVKMGIRSNPVIRVRSTCIWLWITRSQAC